MSEIHNIVKLSDEADIARDLERGLGDSSWLVRAVPPYLRLRMPVCSVTSIALSRYLTEQGEQTELLISNPRLGFDTDMRHVFNLVHTDSGDTVVDAAYSQFLMYAGLTPGSVECDGLDMYPETKIEAFQLNDPSRVIQTLTDTALQVLGAEGSYTCRYHPGSTPLKGMAREDIDHTFREIWNPDHFDTFTPTQGTRLAGLKLAGYIAQRHVAVE